MSTVAYPSIRRLVAIALVPAVAGCTIVNPQLPPHSASGLSEPTYESVVANANTLKQELADRAAAIEQADFWSGFALLGIGIAGLAFGVFESSRTAVLGATVAGAGVLGLRTFVPLATRRQIFVNGQAAVDCAIAATSFGIGVPAQLPAPVPGGVAHATAIAPAASSALPGLATSPATFFALADQTAAAAANIEARSGARAASRQGLGAAPAAPMSAPAQSAAFQIELATATIRDDAQQLTDALARVGETLAQANANRAQRLDLALALIPTAVNRQLAANSVNPEAALTAVRGNVKPSLDAVKDATENAKKTLRELDDNKRRRTDEARRAVEAARATGATPPAAALNDLDAAAAEVAAPAAAAERAVNQLTQVLSDINIPEVCFDGLL